MGRLTLYARWVSCGHQKGDSQEHLSRSWIPGANTCARLSGGRGVCAAGAVRGRPARASAHASLMITRRCECRSCPSGRCRGQEQACTPRRERGPAHQPRALSSGYPRAGRPQNIPCHPPCHPGACASASAARPGCPLALRRCGVRHGRSGQGRPAHTNDAFRLAPRSARAELARFACTAAHRSELAACVPPTPCSALCPCRPGSAAAASTGQMPCAHEVRVL